MGHNKINTGNPTIQFIKQYTTNTFFPPDLTLSASPLEITIILNFVFIILFPQKKKVSCSTSVEGLFLYMSDELLD